MHPKPNQKLITILFLISIYFPYSLCQKAIIPYHVLSPTCTGGEPFECGTIKNLSYPFWGGSLPQFCGLPGFELVCHNNVPIINISSISYRVHDIDFSSYTLNVARQDLWNGACPTIVRNTSLDRDLFELYDHENVTLFFDCTSDMQDRLLYRSFSCKDNTINLFKTGDASSGLGPDISCKNSIFVPVNRESAQSLENPKSSSGYILQAALASGFYIRWRSNSKQYTTRHCEVCSKTPGSDIYIRPNPAATIPNNPIIISFNASAPATDKPRTSGTYNAPTPVTAESEFPRSYNASAPIIDEPKGTPHVQSPADPPGSNNFYYPDSGRGSSTSAGAIAGAILGVAGIFIVATIIFCCLKKQRSRAGHNLQINRNIEMFLLQHGSLAPKRYKYTELDKITKSFNDVLGQGGYGIVYKGMLPDGCLVAVKVLTETNSNGEEFINEVASISRTSHVNIVNLLGFCYDRDKRALVYEFLPNKSLDKFISTGESSIAVCDLDSEKMYKIAIGVAKGLEYLHTGCNTRIVHFDIKPQNILLDENFCPKISDFGLAKLCKKRQSILSTLGPRGTIGYIAPEIFFRNNGGVSYKSDVYSYGMLILRMAGARKCVEMETSRSGEDYFPDKIYEQEILSATMKLDDSLNEEEENERARKLFLIGFWCIQTSPSSRPSMSKVVELLEGSLESIPIPPKPVLFACMRFDQESYQPFSTYTETENSSEVLLKGNNLIAGHEN